VRRRRSASILRIDAQGSPRAHLAASQAPGDSFTGSDPGSNRRGFARAARLDALTGISFTEDEHAPVVDRSVPMA